jgi:hypothetical protein
MLREQRSKLGAISAYFSLSLPSPPPGQPSSLQGMLTVRFREGAPLARIQVLRPFGGVALDMVVDGENLAAYVPKTRTLYRGKAGELAGSAGQGPGTFFRFGLAGPRALKARQAELIVHQKDVVLKLSDGRLELDKQTGRIRRWETEQRQVIYSGYVPVGESAWLPGHIRLLSASGELLAECRLEDIRPLKAETGRFDLSEYPVEEMEDLRELLEGQR